MCNPNPNPTRAVAVVVSVIKVPMLRNASPVIRPDRSLNAYSRSQGSEVVKGGRKAIDECRWRLVPHTTAATPLGWGRREAEVDRRWRRRWRLVDTGRARGEAGGFERGADIVTEGRVGQDGKALTRVEGSG